MNRFYLFRDRKSKLYVSKFSETRSGKLTFTKNPEECFMQKSLHEAIAHFDNFEQYNNDMSNIEFVSISEEELYSELFRA